MAPLRFSAPEPGRLDRAVAARPEIASRSIAERLVAEGAVLVDGYPCSKSHRLEGGEEIVVELPGAAVPPEPRRMDLRVAWEDQHLLVVDKPAGVVVHPSAGQTGATLVHGVLALEAAGGDAERPGIVHRLDRDTSGLLVVARSDEAHARLQALIRRREVARRYLALVRGRPQSRTGRIEAAIGRDRTDRTRHSLETATPREATTCFETLELLSDHALLEVRLKTGRTHQIRVHLEAIELPIAGDPVYGVAGDLGLARQFLHATGLSFLHPFTGERVAAKSPLPSDLAAALEHARAL